MNSFILLLIFFSGFTTLIYESIWFKLLIPVVGSSHYSTIIIYGAFLLGYGLGGYCVYRFSRFFSKKPLFRWLTLEALIAFVGLVPPWLVDPAFELYSALAQIEFFQDQILILRFLICFAFLIIPATLFGILVPVSIMAYKSLGRESTIETPYIYALSTLGAVFGVLFAHLYILPYYNLKEVSLFAALLNFAIASLLFYLRKKALLVRVLGTKNKSSEFSLLNTNVTELIPFSFILLIAFILGGSAIIYEVIFSRLFEPYFFNTVYNFAIILSSFLFSMAMGSLFTKLIYSRTERSNYPFNLALVLLLTTISLVLSFKYLGLISEGVLFYTGNFLTYNWSSTLIKKGLICLIVVFPPYFFFGSLLPSLPYFCREGGSSEAKNVGIIFAFSSLGSGITCFLLSFFLIEAFGSQNIYLWCCWILFLCALSIGLLYLRGLKKRLLIVGLSLIFCVISYFVPENQFKQIIERQYGKILFFSETAADTVVVIKKRDYKTGIVHKKLIFPDSRGTCSTLKRIVDFERNLLHVPLMYHPHAKDIFNIGYGCGNTAGASLQLPLRKLVVADFSPSVKKASHFFKESNYDVLKKENVTYLDDDARNILALSRDKYDIILTSSSSLRTGRMINLYTKDHYEMVKSRLRKDGLFVQHFSHYQHNKNVSDSLYKTFLYVFPNAELMCNQKADICRLIGSKDPERSKFSYDKLNELFKVAPQIESELTEFYGGLEKIKDVVMLDGKRLREFVKEGTIITDQYTYVDYIIPRLSRFQPLGQAFLFNKRGSWIELPQNLYSLFDDPDFIREVKEYREEKFSSN